jgi:small GTP-binding protein
VLIIGDANSGKTTLAHRYVHGVFSVNYKSTIGVDTLTKEFHISNRKFLLHIMDTAGQERFRSVSHIYYRNAHVILVLFDLGSLTSFENTKYWFQEASQANQDHVHFVFLVGCKRDTTRVVTEKEALAYAKLFNAEYAEISSKTCKCER